jgi:4-amino-4-deoxy-L-arabinose transferase-like glycosyltransferase
VGILPSWPDMSRYVVILLPFVCALIALYFVGRKRQAGLVSLPSVSDRTYFAVIGVVPIAAAVAFNYLEFNSSLDALNERYLTRALNIARYGVFGYGEDRTALYPPGYSVLLLPLSMVMGESKWIFFVTNMVFLVACSVMLRYVLLTLSVPRSTANFASLFLFIYPNRLFSTFLARSDVAYSLIFLFALAFLFLYAKRNRRWSYLVGAGMLAGAAALIRGSGMFLIIPLLAGLALLPAESWKTRTLSLLILAASFAMVLTPWGLRNSAMFGKPVLIATNGGYNLLGGNNPHAEDMWNRYPDTLLKTAGREDWNEVQRDSFWSKAAVADIAADPGALIVRGLKRIITTMATDTYSLGTLQRESNAVSLPPRVKSILYACNNFLYYLLMMLVMYFLVSRWDQLLDMRWFIVFIFLCCCCIVFLLIAYPRYKEPWNTVAVLFLAFGQPNGRARGEKNR